MEKGRYHKLRKSEIYMKTQYLRLIGVLLLCFCALVGMAQSTPVSYKIAYNSSTAQYTVYMKTTTAFSSTSAPSSQIGTSQVSVVVPHGMFQNLTVGGGGVTPANGNWTLNTRVDQPVENTTKDYLFFAYSTSPKFPMPANVDIPLFSFSSANCLGDVYLYDITTDPLQIPNVENANPGNNMSILGNGGNAYGSNYGGNTTCVVPTFPDLTTTLGPVPPLTAGVTSNIPVTVANIGTGPATGPISTTVAIPSGITPPSAPFTSNGWSCTVASQNVTCTNPGPINVSGSSLFNIPVTPTNGSIGTTPQFTGVTTPVSGETVIPNNTAPPVSAPAPVVAAPAPDLIISIGSIPSLTAGVSSTIPVTVGNIGNASATGTISASFTIPSGISPPAAPFTSNGWSCSTSAQVVNCTISGPINTGSTSSFNIPVTPTNTSIGTSPQFSANVTPVSNETVVNNNSSTATAGSPVSAAPAPDLVTSIGSIPTLTAGVTSSIPVTVGNIGTAPATGTISASLTVPSGITPSASFSSNGWSCTTAAQVVNCTTAGPLNNGSSSTFNVPITPSNSAVGSTPQFSATATPVSGETVTNNNTSTATAGSPVSAAPAPDLVTTIGTIPTLTAGVSSNIPVTVSNIGTAPATGPISTSVTIPSGINPPAGSFTSNGWSCTVSGQVVTCSNPSSITNGSSSLFNIPILPSNASVGTTPTLSASTTPVSGETATNNNSTSATAPAPVGAGASNCTTGVDCGQGIRYGLKLGSDGITYTVYMKSATAYSGNQAMIATAQATVVLPTGTQITNLTGLQSGMVWVANTRIDHPIENTASDYVSFGFSQSSSPSLFNIPAETEMPLFSFQRTGPCTGSLKLIDNADPFQGISTSTNPGNQMTVVGNGIANAWQCNYTCSVNCPTAILSLVKTTSAATIYQNVPFSYNLTLTNSGTAATSGTVTITDILPAGVQYLSAAGSGWNCSAAGQTVTCTYNSAIAVGAGNSVSVSLNVNPTQLGNISNTATVSGGGSNGIVSSGPCSTCPAGPTTSTVQSNPVDMTISIAQPASLTVGQATNVSVTVSNLSSGNSTAPVTATLSFSNGVTAPASFNGGNGWSCTTTSNQVTCTNPTAINGNQSSVITVPVTPSTSNAGQSLLFLANVASMVGESNLSNNSSFLFTNAIVQSTDLIISLGPVPVLLPSQTSILPVTVSNVGQTTANGSLSVQITLPSGISINNTQLPVGWSITNSSAGPNGSTVVTLSNANTGGLLPGGSLILGLPILPASNTSGAVLFSGNVTPIASESNTSNNSASASGSVGVTDLTISATAPSSSVVGQVTNIQVTVANIGTASTTGSVSVQANLPAGVTLNTSSLPSGWVLQSNVTNGNGSSTVVLVNNALTLSPLGQTTFNLPVVLGAVNANQVTNIVLNVLQVAGESNTANNQTNVSLTPGAPQIVVQVTPPSSLIGGQPGNLTYTFTNVGNAPYSGPFTTNVTLPAGTTLGTLPSGWVIQSQTTNPNGSVSYVIGNSNVNLPIGGNTQLVLPIIPNTSLNGQTISVVNVTPSIPGYPSPNTTQTSSLTVIAPNSPYVLVNVGNPTPVLSVGQNSVIPVTFTNIGNVSSTAPLSVQVTLPSGVTLNQSQLPSGWIVSTSTSGPNGSSIYTLTNNSATVSPNGGQLVLNLPVFVGQGATGTTPSISINVTGQPTGGPAVYNVQQPIGAPNMVVTVNQPSPNLVVGQSSVIPIVVSNNGNASGYGPISATVTIPAGFTVGTMPSGWTLTNTVNNPNGSTTITISNPNNSGLASGAFITANLPITPNSSTVNTNPTFTVVVGPFAGFSTSITQTMTTNIAVQTPAPDLSVVLSQPSPALVVGQTSNLGVLVSNIGTLTANGPLSLQVTLPSNVVLSTSQLPVGWILSGQNTNGNGTVTYTIQNASASIAPGQSLSMNIPVTPASGALNTNPVFTVYAQPVSGEVIVSNNTGSLSTVSSVQAPVAAPDLAVVIPAQSWTLQTGQTTNISFNVINIGSQNASGPLSLTFTLPANFTTNPGSFTTNGWSCNTTGTQVNCSIASGMNVGGQSTLVIPAMPNTAAAGMVNPSFVINVSQASGEVSLVNNIGIINYIGTVQSLVPDLAVSVPSQSFALTAGQNANVTFNVSNVGTATANGPLSLSFTMPANFTTNPATFTTNGWSCGVIGSVVTCSYSGNINVGATTTLVIPVQPQNGAAGSLNPSFFITVNAAIGETVLGNNQATINYNGTVQNGNLLLNAKALLQGAYDVNTGLMRDDLRSKNLIPTAQPYASTPGSPAYILINSGSETVSSGVLATTGNNAIVDWVLLELRSSSNSSQIIASKPALIQRDGDIVSSTDGVSAVSFSGVSAGSYYVAVRHRNHLGIISANPIAFSSTAGTADLTSFANIAKIPSVGNHPAIVSGTKAMMWAGNTSGDANVIFQGPNTDVDGSFFTIITDVNNTGLVTNFINSGYRMSDVNMDGKTIFQGPTNEPDIIFFNVILHPENTSSLANFIIRQHLP